MVRGIEQLYQDTADAVSGVLEKHVQSDFAQVWIRAEMLGEICHVACRYSPAAEPDKTRPLASNAGLVDIYLIFDKLSRQMEKIGNKGSTISLLINSDGEYFFELGTGSNRHNHVQAGMHLENEAREISIIETVHFSPGALSV